jgi:pimeloyl-ACP methyl ester carboxylesterase
VHTTQYPATGERRIEVNGLTLAYEAFGRRTDEPLVLITGLGMQMVCWRVEFCEALAERGFYVIRFDNRDTGLSTKIEDGPRPNLWAAFAGYTESASYNLRDMADDVAGLIEGLGVEAAHLFGVSLGGAIAQTVAIAHPDRVLSLTSVMSTTGARLGGLPNPSVLLTFMRRPKNNPEAYVQHVLKMFRVARSPGFAFDEEGLRAMLEASVRRCYHPAASPRQMLAMLDSGDRTSDLRQLRVPALVVHGKADVLMPVQGGRKTAHAIPGSTYLEIDGMGHDLPRELWPLLIDAFVDTAARAEGSVRRRRAVRNHQRPRFSADRQSAPAAACRTAARTATELARMQVSTTLWLGSLPASAIRRIAHRRGH